ncbi:DUF2163 domain-containing protein [Maritimibacter sp. DP1N21-5]|uniref:DUF2163 domain-containing protein n=1 Tax=Maritimibacter sp. DP1N21-5 TaxID=2836867 RepID=UPI001C46FB8B|nr:DUF2163 domain-containing protein [Maritimibacter sp. DP1N21-5]MBV7410163.1 DUF2163 domain-containing protein [Maritimibacter sp. DP1N21-5]
MTVSQALLDHLASGITTLARCWRLTRRDGWSRGFTDHDGDLTFDDLTYRADTGLSARAFLQTTGLSIDNTEALGALSDVSVTEADIRAGRFDGAEVEVWLVNWADVSERMMLFRGHLGEITRSGGAFRAELLGLAEVLNQPQGRVYQKSCSAVLGDGKCRFDVGQIGFTDDAEVVSVDHGTKLVLSATQDPQDRWYERGILRVLSGAAEGLTGVIKNDRRGAVGRDVALWQELRAAIVPGDRVRIVAGCDKQPGTCKAKFDNILNFRGFPSIPGEDRLLSVPVRGTTTDTTSDAK